MLPRCAVFIIQSLDGRIARANGSTDFLDVAVVADHELAADSEDHGSSAFFDSCDCRVIDGSSYNAVAHFEDPPWQPTLRVVVLTEHPRSAVKNVEFSAEEPAALLARLGVARVQRVHVDGAGAIARFWRAGVIDEVIVTVVPVIVGAGRRLLGEGEREARLQLTESRTYPNSVVQLRYRVQR